MTRPPLAPIGNGPGASENEHRLGVAGVVAAGADGELLPLQAITLTSTTSRESCRNAALHLTQLAGNAHVSAITTTNRRSIREPSDRLMGGVMMVTHASSSATTEDRGPCRNECRNANRRIPGRSAGEQLAQV